MRKIMVIAVREYRAAVQTKAFIISVILMPVLMGGSIVVQRAMKDKVDTRDKRFAVVDQTGLVYDAIEAEVERRNLEDIFIGELSRPTAKRVITQTL